MSKFWQYFQISIKGPVQYFSMLIAINGVGRKFSRGRGQQKKDRKIAKKTKNSTIKPLPGGATEKRPKN